MLTNQEKIEIKVRALKLAEDLDEAKSIYAFLVDGLDDDPLMAGVPPPVFREKSEEIDWDRPQLFVRHKAIGRIVKTTGDHTRNEFYGRVIQAGNGMTAVGEGGIFSKGFYEYHAEVNPEPQRIDWSRPQLVNNGLGLIIKTNGIFNWSKFEGTVVEIGTSSHHVGHMSNEWLKSVFVYHGEIPQEQQKGPKTTGLNFSEAMQAVFSGKKVRRPSWVDGLYYYEELGAVSSSIEAYHSCTTKLEFFATDWQIV